MTDHTDLMKDLAAAGRLLDETGAEREGQLAGHRHADVLPLTPASPVRERRWMVGAAAAILALAGAVVADAVTRGDEGVPVASTPSTVALVPSSLDGWDEVSAYDLDATEKTLRRDRQSCWLDRAPRRSMATSSD